MQQFAAVIIQVYSEVGYYVRLEDLVKSDETQVRVWLSSDYSTDGIDDNDITPVAANALPDPNRWAGPYKKYRTTTVASTGDRPLDPWGREYRMFWLNDTHASSEPKIPAGANGTMVIISAGSDKKSESVDGDVLPGEGAISEEAVTFSNFDPKKSNIEEDLYFNFNAGIQ